MRSNSHDTGHAANLWFMLQSQGCSYALYGLVQEDLDRRHALVPRRLGDMRTPLRELHIVQPVLEAAQVCESKRTKHRVARPINALPLLNDLGAGNVCSLKVPCVASL